MKKITKLFAGIAVFSATVLGAAALAGCAGGGNGINSVIDDDKIAQINTVQEAYGFSAATAGMVISGMNGGTAGAKAAKNRTSARFQVTDEATIASLNEYMMLVESLLSDGNFEITSGANDNAEYAQYAYRMTAAYYDINGNRMQYETYYNQTLEGSYTDRDDDWWEEDEITDVYSVDGVMLIDGAAYPMKGRFVNETEGRESESTQTLKVTLDEAANSYLLVTQESEDEGSESETEYVYALYSGGRMAERTTFEYESERGETEIKMTVADRVNGTSQMFEFEKENEHGREIIKMTVGGNGAKREYIVRVETDADGNSQYVYYSGNDAVWRGERWD